MLQLCTPNMPAEPTDRFYFKELRLQQFRALASLLEQGSFEQAAKGLELSRTSVWRQVRALERELQLDLVKVGGRRALLTADGQLLAGMVKSLVSDFDQVLHEFRQRRHSEAERLVIASTPQLLTYDLPPVIAELRKRHPQLQLSLTSTNSEDCLAKIKAGDVDVSILGHQADATPAAQWVKQPFVDYPFVALIPPQHSLAKRRRITLEHLAEEPLIVPSSEFWPRKHMDACYQLAGLAPPTHIVMETNYSRSAVPLVRMGYGVAVVTLSETLVKQEIDPLLKRGHLEMRSLKHLFGVESTNFICRKLSAARPSVVTLRSLLGAL
jgi:DNA-binding transcriptional LysR family regulator